MELRLTNNSATQTDLVDNSGRVVYSIDTPFGLMNRVTTVRKQGDGEPGEVAQIQWHRLRRTKLVHGGQTCNFDEFLESSGRQYDRTFPGPDGRTYTWRSGSGREELHPETGQAVAHFTGRKAFKDRNPTLHIEDSATHMSDMIVLTWIYMECERRKNAASAAETNALTSLHGRGVINTD